MAMVEEGERTWRIGENVPWSVSWTGESSFTLHPSRDFPGLTDLVQQGFNPTHCADPLYFNHPELRAYVPLDAPLYDRIVAGAIQL